MKVRTVLRYLALVVAVMTPIAAQAQYAFRFFILSNPASLVRISNPVGLRHAGTSYECVDFMNLSEKTITRIEFKFIYIDAQRENVGFDLLDRTGSFTPNGMVSGPPPAGVGSTFDPGVYANCLHFRFPRQGIAINVVMVNRVDYDDGTVWTAPTPQSSATPSPTPESSPTATP
jgi:hypothetical protein